MPYRGYSWIGRQLHRLGLLKGNNAFEPMNGYAETAVLKDDASGDWRVETASG
jgi:hypothetical protein